MLGDIMDNSNDTLNYTYCYYCGTPVWCVIGYLTTTVTLLGNILTMFAILLSKKLSSSIANYFVFSLAVSDCFVGFFIPYHMLFYILKDFGKVEIHCLLRFGLILFACSSSISNLVLIAADRYVAIVYPFYYTRFVNKRIAYICITIGWLAAFTMATVPIFWNDWQTGMTCEIFNVLSINYIKYLLCPMFAIIWITMLFLYSRICKEANGHEKRIRSTASTCSSIQGAHFRESKSFQMTLMILGCFTICWCPFFIVILYARMTRNTESSTLYEVFFNLAMINSSFNPLIYSWKNSNFRKAFLSLLKCRSPDQNHSNNFITNHIPSKRNSDNGICNILCTDMNGSKNSSVANFSNTLFPHQMQNPENLPTISGNIEDDEDSGLQMSTINDKSESNV